jgi:hypothetical protein
MGKQGLYGVVRSLRTAALKHSPEILTGLGIAGMVAAGILAVRATPKALILLEERKNGENADALKPVETVKTVWRCYLPSVLTAGAAAACLIGASSVNLRRNAALSAAFTLSESTLRAYQKRVIETVGEKKERTVRDAAAKEKIEAAPIGGREVFITKKGDTLCFDPVSGRYFKSDIDLLKRVENELNRRMRDELYISLNEFYGEIGLSGIKLGEDLGWKIDWGYIDLYFSAQLADDGTPCLVLNYSLAPRYEYNR